MRKCRNKGTRILLLYCPYGSYEWVLDRARCLVGTHLIKKVKGFLLSINCLLIVIYLNGSYVNVQIVASIIFIPSAYRCLIIGLIKFEFRGKIS